MNTLKRRVSNVVLLACLPLAGCNFFSEPRTVYVTKEVPVIVQVPCKIETIEVPFFPFQEAAPEEDFGTKLGKALAELEVRKGYEGVLEAAIRGCQ